MRYVVYIDRLFLLQLVQSCVLLLLTRAFLRSTVTLKRIVFSAAAGTLFFCIIFLLSGISAKIKLLLFAAGSLCTLWLAFRVRSLQIFCRAVILYHAAAFLLAGALYALLNATGKKPAMRTMQAALCSAAAGAAALYLLKFWKKDRERLIVPVTLEDGENRIMLKALIDSGNSLCDPISQRPVCVVEREVLQGKIPLDIPEKFRLIPYHSLGKKHGMMQAVEIEKLKVKKEGQELVIGKALLGLYEGRVTQSGGYQMILHPALLEHST